MQKGFNVKGTTFRIDWYWTKEGLKKVGPSSLNELIPWFQGVDEYNFLTLDKYGAVQVSTSRIVLHFTLSSLSFQSQSFGMYYRGEDKSLNLDVKHFTLPETDEEGRELCEEDNCYTIESPEIETVSKWPFPDSLTWQEIKQRFVKLDQLLSPFDKDTSIDLYCLKDNEMVQAVAFIPIQKADWNLFGDLRLLLQDMAKVLGGESLI